MSIIVIFIRRFKNVLGAYVGVHAATVFYFFLALVSFIVMIFAILGIFRVSTTTLLLGGGIISIVIGLVISTLAGNVLAGTMLLVTNQFNVGDNVVIGGIPGKIEEITGMFTRVSNDLGGERVIPNMAIIQGSVIVSKIPSSEALPNRLPYKVGDRIVTTYANEEGSVKEISSFETRIQLDSGREIVFLNNSVLSGLIAVAKVAAVAEGVLNFTLTIEWDAEKAVAAIEQVARSDSLTFKSSPKVQFVSVRGGSIELRVTCEVEPTKKDDAKSAILRAAYLSKNAK